MQGTVGGHDGEADLTITASSDIATGREGMGREGERMASPLVSPPVPLCVPSDYLQWFCQSRPLHEPLHFGKGDREEVGESGSYVGAVAHGNL